MVINNNALSNSQYTNLIFLISLDNSFSIFFHILCVFFCTDEDDSVPQILFSSQVFDQAVDFFCLFRIYICIYSLIGSNMNHTCGALNFSYQSFFRFIHYLFKLSSKTTLTLTVSIRTNINTKNSQYYYVDLLDCISQSCYS